ncbi:LamG domain-containing protein [Siphonobacter curvatus]|nr:hypothetical protein [Siphonobacter curvatus]
MKLRMLLLGVCFVVTNAWAQTTVPFDTTHWMFAGKIAHETYRGQACIELTEGNVYLKDSTFKNGIIEFDMALSQHRYFPGFGFRVQDQNNFELVYLRPHQLGNPDAIQYTPVFKGEGAWQLYYGDGYSTAVTYPFKEWVPIKLIVQGSTAEVYLANATKPDLIIHALKQQGTAGRISLTNESTTSVRFANFRYTKSETAPLRGPFKPQASPTPGTVLTWQVSSPFAEKHLNNRYDLPPELTRRLSWQTMACEPSGLINVSRLHPLDSMTNTVFAKVTLIADQAQIKKFQFGFSDRVKVYLNGQLIYGGQDVFLSRDYRFLGTIGYFDELYLRLKKGTNELWLAIAEDFGGWGLKGLIPDPTGLKVK